MVYKYRPLTKEELLDFFDRIKNPPPRIYKTTWYCKGRGGTIMIESESPVPSIPKCQDPECPTCTIFDEEFKKHLKK